ncbi:hypothetical protein BCR43DRAFT_492432 [Syncephalastrum racemosum]|uniref:Uncharacterized protein n=1 Tax=Syncephalastrum racemosum TaxID=13706 RepID=A0A1X2HDQ6_SYNRA|nr:hypothetical protein BCR43DRAFT_492432 [Syncephalastrum racemosum]
MRGSLTFFGHHIARTHQKKGKQEDNSSIAIRNDKQMLWYLFCIILFCVLPWNCTAALFCIIYVERIE